MNVPLTPNSTLESLGLNASFEQIPVGNTVIDVFKVTDLSRSTVNLTMNKADARIAEHPSERTYFVLFDQSTVKTSILMSPYMKSRVEQAYGSAQCKIFAAVIVSPGFLDEVSKGFLEKQESVKTGQVVTQFFKTYEAGFQWLKGLAEQEN